MIAWRSMEASERAEALIQAGKPAEGVAVLAKEVDRTGFFYGADALWRLYLRLEQPEEARKLTAKLLARQDPRGLASGHALAAREAAIGGDAAAAERHYRAYLSGPHPDRKVAAELLLVAAPGEEEGPRRAELARELCSKAYLRAPNIDDCASEMLGLAGDDQEALAAMTKAADRFPDSTGTLRTLAQRAAAAGDWETAEGTLRRILAIEPGDVVGWIDLANLYANLDDQPRLTALVEEARRALGRVPPDVVLVFADQLLARGENRRAIDALRRAREELAPGEESGWINLKLRTAYTALGSEQP